MKRAFGLLDQFLDVVQRQPSLKSAEIARRDPESFTALGDAPTCQSPLQRLVDDLLRARCLWLESRGGDSRIREILIQAAGWAEASRNAEALFARLA
jgi:hypothetical protein